MLTGETFETHVDCVVADNCSTNKCLANLLDVPLVGCASHRLHLVTQKYMEPCRSDLQKFYGNFLISSLYFHKTHGGPRRSTCYSGSSRFCPCLSQGLNSIHSVSFERACVTVQEGERLNDEEQEVLRPLLCDDVSWTSDDAYEGSFADAILAARSERQRRVPPTSNICERLFSLVKGTYSTHRHRLTPMTVEALLFLELNRDYWGPATVANAVSVRQANTIENSSP
ncbi:TPA: hypothetical protein N0F65_000999 [Lagenidium giganteum]|uniref:Transposase n=1 Tax=Lagenidium giganteum TaxID=4803 RepID=A0AAV2Z0C8_9STRA|nr:TPA: hypothetical protein N0F65_000999 [Lagenidium giganteum]